MKMSHQKAIKIHYDLLFTMIILFSSCSKEEPIVFPLLLKSTAVVKNGDIKLFIAGKQVFDKTLLARFIDTAYFNKQNQKVGADEITFFSPHSAIFNSNEYQRFSVEKNGNRFLFHSAKKFPMEPEGPHSFNAIFKHQHWEREPIYGGGYLTRAVHFGYGSYRHLSINIMAYKFTYHRLGARGMDAGTSLNEFSGDISFLQKQDTLAIQEYSLVFQ